MSGFSFFYIQANLVCMIVFGIILGHNRFSIDRQEKQICFDRVLIAFMCYFVADSLWAAMADGVIPGSLVSIIQFLLFVGMAAIIYFWLLYVMAYEQIPHRNRPLNRFAMLFPFFISSVILAVNFILAPQALVTETLEATPLFTLYLTVVPDIYIITILFYTIRRARNVETRAEKRKHLFIGAFPLMVSVSGLLGEIINPFAPTFCFACLILMLVFYIQSLEQRISQDPLTQLNNRGQLVRYCANKANLFLEGRQTVVVMMDIDRFKAINDTFGHAEGDRALLTVAEALKTVLNSHSMPSFLCRYGGDEFILILHPATVDETDELIAAVRAEICKADCAYPLSISAGYDVLSPHEENVLDCIRRADRNLYLEKGKR